MTSIESASPILLCEDTVQRWLSVNQEVISADTKPTDTKVLGFPASRTVTVYVSHLVY